MEVNTYIAWYEGSGECVVVDPAGEPQVTSILQINGLTLKAILLTHGHFDHILGVARLKKKTGAKVFISKTDACALEGGRESLSYLFGIAVEPTKVDEYVSDGMVFTEAGITFRALHTPGHTKGGMCYIVEDERVIFSGDTLFNLSYGRTDFPGGSADELYESIMFRLFSLEGDYRVLPGHESETTLDFERKHNPCVRGGIMA